MNTIEYTDWSLGAAVVNLVLRSIKQIYFVQRS